MKILIFGGTTEGRKLSEALSRAGIDVTLSVATEFGRSIALNADADADADKKTDEQERRGGSGFSKKNLQILSDRLGKAEMTAMLGQGTFSIVIDATHPYAALATKNIRSACLEAGTEYYRLKRPQSAEIAGITYASDVNAAVEILNNNDEKVLLSTGSKDLEPFTHVKNYGERFFVRILPIQDSLQKALELGFRGSNIICMQGPFNMEMNAAILKMTGAKYLITKDSGDVGGFEAKISAALGVGCEVIVIARPAVEDGYTLTELLDVLNIKDESNVAWAGSSAATGRPAPETTAYFPLFVDMRGKKILVIGGGSIAERRISALSSYGADITVISPEVTEVIERLASRCVKKKYQNGDIAAEKPFLVIAATDDRQANHEAMLEAVSLDINISVADRREECTCYFPAIAENENFIAGLVSKNGDHSGVKQTAEKIRRLL